MQRSFITVVICTHRRNKLLQRCLNSLKKQTAPSSEYTVLVVDNACSAECKKLCLRNDVDYVDEPKKGLSFARNKSISSVNSEWLLFLDDDAMAKNDLIANLSFTVKYTNIRVIGGMYYHYFDETPPKWLLRYYLKPIRAMDTDMLNILPPGKYLSGGILAIKTGVFKEIGGFRTDLGMSGEKFGYGEEDEFQDRVRALPIPVYFSPDMAMDHLVSLRKYTISSRIKMSYSNGRAQAILAKNELFSLVDLLKVLARITFLTIPYDIARWLFRPDFHWQNAVVSTLTKYANALGRYKGTN